MDGVSMDGRAVIGAYVLLYSAGVLQTPPAAEQTQATIQL
jgi:hypothetical protein